MDIAIWSIRRKLWCYLVNYIDRESNMEVKYGVYKVAGSKSELIIAYGEPHVPMRTRRKYAGKKAKIKAIEQLTGNVLDAHLSTSEINAYIGQYIFGTSQWAEYHRLFECFASELEQVPKPIELKFHVIVEFDEAMCRPDDERLIYMVKQALENNSIDTYRGLQNPIISFFICEN